jgi:OmpA-OmpF porin, OOP family
VLIRESRRVVSDVALGPELTFGAAAGLLLLDETLQLGPELYGATAIAGDEPLARANTNVELLLGGRYRFLDDFQVGLAAGPGLTQGVGTPAFRGVFMLSYSPPAEREEPLPPIPVDGDRDGDSISDSQDACPDVAGVPSADPSQHGCPPPGDRDGDGILDPQDACLDVPGVQSPNPAKNGCPADSDEDGILDLDDACPTVPGVPSDDPKKHGCPSDRDGDTIFDAEDACPDRPGVRSDDPAKNGCPVDTDGDGIMNDVDACPLEAGPANEDPAKNGCPTLVRVTQDKIEILQQPRFAFDRAAVLPESAELLRQVAQVLREHPEITKVRIEGHTDDRGPDAYNKRLSEQRANAVRDWLVKEGITSDRLVAVGHGEERPLVTNDSEDNRAKNRRVEFHIQDRTAGPTEKTP